MVEDLTFYRILPSVGRCHPVLRPGTKPNKMGYVKLDLGGLTRWVYRDQIERGGEG